MAGVGSTLHMSVTIAYFGWCYWKLFLRCKCLFHDKGLLLQAFTWYFLNRSWEFSNSFAMQLLYSYDLKNTFTEMFQATHFLVPSWGIWYIVMVWKVEALKSMVTCRNSSSSFSVHLGLQSVRNMRLTTSTYMVYDFDVWKTSLTQQSWTRAPRNVKPLSIELISDSFNMRNKQFSLRRRKSLLVRSHSEKSFLRASPTDSFSVFWRNLFSMAMIVLLMAGKNDSPRLRSPVSKTFFSRPPAFWWPTL